MPIGKNSIKRVTNSGYSNVKTTAPDMENSHVEEKVAPPTATAKKAVAKAAKPTAKTEATKAKKPAPKSTATAKDAAKTEEKSAKKETVKAAKAPTAKTATKTKKVEKVTKNAEKSAEKTTAEVLNTEKKNNEENVPSYVNVGRAMPDYLL